MQLIRCSRTGLCLSLCHQQSVMSAQVCLCNAGVVYGRNSWYDIDGRTLCYSLTIMTHCAASLACSCQYPVKHASHTKLYQPLMHGTHARLLGYLCCHNKHCWYIASHMLGTDFTPQEVLISKVTLFSSFRSEKADGERLSPQDCLHLGDVGRNECAAAIKRGIIPSSLTLLAS